MEVGQPVPSLKEEKGWPIWDPKFPEEPGK